LTHAYKQPINTTSLLLQGHPTIESALRKAVEEESMTGDNKVECEDCTETHGSGKSQKFDAQKKSCLDGDSLPPLLVLHLKRFKMNYETFEVQKQHINTSKQPIKILNPNK
jgi:ubiquitin C-terminal hydrolase